MRHNVETLQLRLLPQSFELAIKVAKDNTLLAYSLVRGKLGSVPASSKADHSDRPLLADIH